MARCKCCIHYDVCLKFADVRIVVCGDKADGRCKLFKSADVVAKSEEGAECPTCYGTGRIGTTDWLTKGLSKKQIAEEKAKAVAEHEQHIKSEVAREIISDMRKLINGYENIDIYLDRIEKKYTGENNNEN